MEKAHGDMQRGRTNQHTLTASLRNQHCTPRAEMGQCITCPQVVSVSMDILIAAATRRPHNYAMRCKSADSHTQLFCCCARCKWPCLQDPTQATHLNQGPLFLCGQTAFQSEWHGCPAGESELAACHVSVYGAELVVTHRSKGAVVVHLQGSSGKAVDVDAVDNPEVTLLCTVPLVDQRMPTGVKELV